MPGRYLKSSVRQLDRIDILFEQIGYPTGRVNDRLRALAERAGLAIQQDTVPDWLRSLTLPQADSLIAALEIELASMPTVH